MHRAVSPVVPCVLHDKKDGDLVGHLVNRRERNASFETEVLAHRVEKPDLRKLDGEVGQEDQKRALCLLPGGGNLVLLMVSSAYIVEGQEKHVLLGSCTS